MSINTSSLTLAIPVADAREVLHLAPGRIYKTSGPPGEALEVDVAWYGTAEETVARCGVMVVYVQTPDARRGETPVEIGDLPEGATPIDITNIDDRMREAAAAALASHLIRVVNGCEAKADDDGDPEGGR
jgi:hypothetical protein